MADWTCTGQRDFEEDNIETYKVGTHAPGTAISRRQAIPDKEIGWKVGH